MKRRSKIFCMRLELEQYQFVYASLFGVLGGYVLGCGIIAVVLAILSVLLAFSPSSRGASELGSAYECGFLPFDRSRTRFDVNFFVVGLLFLLFDLEVIFILPWGLVINHISLVGFGGGVLFFALLGLAFFYELAVDALAL